MKFRKKKILEMSGFSNRQDLLSVLLDDDKEYTKEDVNKIIDKFMKGTVK